MLCCSQLVSAVTTTLIGKSLDIEISDTLGVSLFAANVNAKTGLRTRLADFSFSFAIDRIGMWPDRPFRTNRPNEAIWPSIFNISLYALPVLRALFRIASVTDNCERMDLCASDRENVPKTTTFPIEVSAEGVPIRSRRETMQIPIQSNIPGIDDTTIGFRASWLGAAENDTFIEYVDVTLFLSVRFHAIADESVGLAATGISAGKYPLVVIL
jgi:hypothetical protein